MDEHFRGKKLWIGLGVLAVIFLCLALCGLGAMAMVVLRTGPAYGVARHVQPPVGEEDTVPPGIHGAPMDVGRLGLWSPFGFVFGGIRLLFGVALFGLFLLLLIGLARRVFWSPWHWRSPHRYGPPESKEGAGRPQAWTPWAWPHHRGHWGPPPCWGAETESTGEAADSEGTDSADGDPQE